MLASDTTRVLYDVRVAPRTAIEYYGQYRDIFATRLAAQHVRLVSREFPWTFDIDLRASRENGYGGEGYVTCGDVWKAIYNGLQEPIKDGEWALLVTGGGFSERRRNIERGLERRGVGEGRYPRRIDWLGKDCLFRGIGRDEEYAARVLLPGREYCPDTYLMKFARPTSEGVYAV